MADEPSPEAQQEAQALAWAVEVFMRDHEQECHEGAICMTERAGLLAFLAHKTGVRSVTAVGMLVKFIQEYEEHHEEHAREGIDLENADYEHLH